MPLKGRAATRVPAAFLSLEHSVPASYGGTGRRHLAEWNPASQERLGALTEMGSRSQSSSRVRRTALPRRLQLDELDLDAADVRQPLIVAASSDAAPARLSVRRRGRMVHGRVRDRRRRRRIGARASRGRTRPHDRRSREVGRPRHGASSQAGLRGLVAADRDDAESAGMTRAC